MADTLASQLSTMDPKAFARAIATGTNGLDDQGARGVAALLSAMVIGGGVGTIEDAIADARKIVEGATPEQLADLAS